MLRTTQKAAGITYDRSRISRDVDRIIAAFTPEIFAARKSWGERNKKPVFIVGMPRAGSSLIEQIAASHPQIGGLGESKAIGGIVQNLGWSPSPRWTPATIRATSEKHLRMLESKFPTAARIIDKMPDNIFQLGLIATLFPGAKIIFAARDPRDICLSCFFQHFAEPLGFDTDLADCAHRIRELDRLTAHWRAVLPLETMVLSYDSLIANPESESRMLINFLGLEWDSACLDFHKTARPVRTASWAQVRQPIYASAAGRWQNYSQIIDNSSS